MEQGSSRKIHEPWILLALCAPAFPETLIRVGSGTMGRYVFAFIGLAVAHHLWRLFRGKDRPHGISSRMLLTGLGAAYMISMGILQESELKFFAADVIIFSSFMFGLYWGESRDDLVSIQNLALCYNILVWMLAINVIGLFLGYIPPSDEGSRVYNYGLFACTAIISMLFPIVYCSDQLTETQQSTRRQRSIAVVGIVMCIGASLLSGTRSVLLVTLSSVAMTVWLRLEGMKRVVSVLAILLFCIAFEGASVSDLQIANSTLVQRLMSTDLESSDRYQEVLMMFDQLKGHIYTGLGFGSRFWSPIDRDGDILVMCPHIGILTLWQKGGAGVFLLLMGIPVAWSAINVCCRRGCGVRKGVRRQLPPAVWSAGCLIYSAQASLSGGWQCSALFLFGALLASAQRGVRRPVHGEIPSRMAFS